MNRFVIAVVAVGLALSSGLGSQGRGQPVDDGNSAPSIPALVQPPGATQGGHSSSSSPGTQGASYELMTTQIATATEEHYRNQLTAAGWKVEAKGGDATIAFSRFTISAGVAVRSGTLVVTPIEAGRAYVTVRMIQSMSVPAPLAPKTESEMMDWMLRQLPQSTPDEPRVVPPPATVPSELLPPGFKNARTATVGNRVTVAGTVNNSAPSDLSTFFAGLRKAGWSDPLRGRFTENFTTAEFCKGDMSASMVFYVQPKRVVMAGVSVGNAQAVNRPCDSRFSQSPGISAPIVVVPAEWSPAHVDGGGGSSRWRSGIRLNTTTSIAPVLADVESQIVATGFKAVSRTGDASQSVVRFESTQGGTPAIVVLSLTKLPWPAQIDAVYDLVTPQKR